MMYVILENTISFLLDMLEMMRTNVAFFKEGDWTGGRDTCQV